MQHNLYKGSLRVTTMTGAKKKASLKQSTTVESFKPFITVDEEYHIPGNYKAIPDSSNSVGSIHPNYALAI